MKLFSMTIRISWFCQEQLKMYLIKTDEMQRNVKLLNHYFTLKVLFNANFSIKIAVGHFYWLLESPHQDASVVSPKKS